MRSLILPLALQNHKYLGIIVKVMGAICMAVGLFTMVMWKIHRIDLLVFGPTTMFFNTALCFTLSGAALMCLETRYEFVTKVLGCVVAIFSMVVLSQDIFQVNWGIDELFAEFYYPFPAVIPGRMSIQTSVNFILSGGAFLVLADETLSRFRIVLGLFFGALVAIISLMASFGYFFQLAHAYGWTLINPISMNTAILFLFLSTGLILFAIWKSLHLRISVADYGHLIIFLVVLVGAFLLWQALVNHSSAAIDRMTIGYGQNLRVAFERALGSSVKRLDPILFRLSGRPDELTEATWKKFTDYLFESEKYVEYVGLFLENFEPTFVASPTGVRVTPEELKKVLSGEQEIFIGTSFSPDGHRHMFMIVYLVPSQQSREYMVRLINLDTLMEVAGAHIYGDDMYYTITQNGKSFYHFPGVQMADTSYLKKFNSSKYDEKWEIKVWPTPSFIAKNRTALPEITLGIGFLFACLLACAFSVALTSCRRAKALDKMQANLLIAHEIANLGGWVWDLKNDNIHFTAQALKILGLDVKQSILPAGQFFHLVHPNETEKLKKAISTMKSGRSGYSEIYTFVRPDEEIRRIRFAAEVSAFHDHFPVEISGILQDVTKLKFLEEELYQSQKLDLIGQLTGGIAHDFNNILMVIQGNLELLSFMLDENSKEYKKVETALTACTRGSALTKRLLAFARRDTLHPEVLDLKTYMESFSHILKPTLGETIEFSIDLDPGVLQITADPHQLESALLNLIINSRDAIGQGGKLELKVDSITPEHQDLLKKKQIPYGSYVRISVKDSGVGIPPDVMKRIFEPFFTTKPPNKGTGLGLSMVKSFVEQSKGLVHVSSEVGKGTTVELYFPSYVEEKSTIPEKLSATGRKRVQGTETILVAEDEEEVRSATVEFLKNLGYTVLEAKSGDAAFELLKKHKKVDFLFTDIVMPGSLSGQELAERAKTLVPTLKVLYTSGYPEKVKGNGHILSPLIIKPYKLIDLAVSIRNIIAEE